MNARQAVNEGQLEVKWMVERAKDVSKVRKISLLEALDYGRDVKLEYAKTQMQKAGIELRYKLAKEIIENELKENEMEEVKSQPKRQKSKAYTVTYTRAVGGSSEVIVKAQNEAQALKNAKHLVFTGSDFRDAKEVQMTEYSKPRKQGFAGVN